MAVWHTSNNVLRDTGQQNVRSRTYSIPITLRSCKINTTYRFLINGIDMGWACKPFGGVLGGPLTSDNTGTLKFQVMFDQQHSNGLLTNADSINNVLKSKLKCQALGPNDENVIFYLPLHLKPTQ